MSPVLDRPDTLLAAWKAGPDPALVSALLGERPVTTRLERVHFPGKRPVQLVYAARLRSGRIAQILAEHRPDDPGAAAAGILASLRKSRNGQRGALEGCPVLADRAAGLVLRRAGLDERLPGLRMLYDGAFAGEVVGVLTGLVRPCPVSTNLVAHRLGKRAVIRIDLPEKRLFARLSAIKSTDGEGRLARHRAVRDALDPGSPLAIPGPLGAMPGIGLSLFAELPGQPPRFDRDHAAVARALAALRDLDLPGLPIHTGADESAILGAWHSRCRTYLPDLAASLAPALERIRGRLEASTARPAPCHRDLHEGQILVSDGTAGLLDFDTLSQADPALDRGNLLAHLFLAGIDEGPLARELGGRDTPLWRRAALLRLAMIYAFADTPAATIRRLLKEAEA